GLEMPYLGERYLDRIRLAAEEANRLGLATWIYDEMNWPSGTADKRVLQARPDLAQRYIECLAFTIQDPWFMRLTGEDGGYLDVLGDGDGPPIEGLYSDEPAMHYFVTAGDNPVVPWTKDMIRRFAERNGYDLRPRLPDLFFDVRPDSSRVRHDFYNTLTDLYSDAYYRQIHDWCRE